MAFQGSRNTTAPTVSQPTAHAVRRPAWIAFILAFSFAPASILHAAQPALPSWIPLAKPAHGPAQVTCKAPAPDKLDLTISIPGLEATETDGTHGIHGRLIIPESGHTSDIGKPELPVIRRLIVAPPGAILQLAWKGAPVRKTLANIGLHGPVHPVQRPVPKIPGALGKAAFDKDAVTYATDAWLPITPVALKEAGTLFGRRLVMIEVSPVAYNPARNETLFYSHLEVTVTFGGIKGTSTPAPLLPSEAATLQSVTLNSEAPISTTSEPGRLLIIAPGDFTNTLTPFLSRKISQGWVVDLTTTPTNNTTTAIQSLVHGRYTNLATRPAALILVGDTAQVPCYTGTQADNPPTDLYYGCMDGASDWIPEFPVGRFSAADSTTLSNIIAKTVAAETNTPSTWNNHASFVAGYDATYYALAEATHNTVITNHMTPGGFISDRLYRGSFGSGAADFSAAFNEGRTLVAYSGHGGQDGWYFDSRNWNLVYGESQVSSLANSARYPFVCVFACLAGDFSQKESIAETWLRAPDKGACAVLASSVTSYWDEDDILEKKLFDALFSDTNPTAGKAFFAARQLYRLYYGDTATTRRYYEMYNLLGDPALRLLRRAVDIQPEILATAYSNQPYAQTLTAVGITPPCTWSLAAGMLPPGYSLNPTNGQLQGTCGATGTYAFTVSLTDATLASTSRSFSLPVANHLRPPANTILPTAGSNRAYGITLAARDGVPPVTWEMLPPSYSVSNTPSAWQGGGTPKSWRADDSAWELTLPWPFPFFGQTCTSLWVCSNGYLDFRNASTLYQNSTADLIANRLVAPLWDDLDTSSGNIYVSTNAECVVIRWSGIVYGTSLPINTEAMLYQSGRITFNYGTPAHSGLSPTIGISAGNGNDYYLASYDSSNTIPAAVSATFNTLPFPNGMTLSSNGTISGSTPVTGTLTIPCRIRDSAAPADSTNFNLTLTILDSQLTTTQGTPLYWLSHYGLTNAASSTEALLDGDHDGMAAWQEYLAGTDPTNALSALRLISLAWSNQYPLLTWQSASSSVTPQPPYVIWASTNLATTNWLALTNILIRTPPYNEAAVPPPPPNVQTFYRISISN